MSETPNSRCPRCGGLVLVDEGLCPRCLLGAGSDSDASAPEDRLFQEALALEPTARLPFIREVTRENPSLYTAVLLLLEGYNEAGGDAAGATGADAPSARLQWAISNAEEPGTVIDHFRLIRRVGEGGMGSVWQAEQTEPVKRTVALKVIKLGMDTRTVVKRFERERQTLALLNHPNIAQVFEAGATTLGRPYFAMELVKGRSITAYCESAGLDLKARLKLFQEVCAAVEHAHQKGVIHRDLKPSNILVAGGLVKIIDFGVAKATQAATDTLFTQQAQILGTPAYMSPEQAQSAGVDIDTRTDVYALGVVLYELLTGTLPIDSARLANTSVAEMQRILLEEDPPTPSTRITRLRLDGPLSQQVVQRGSALQGDLDWVVMKAIRKDRTERYPSAAALSEDIRRYLANEPVSAVPPTLAYQTGKFVRRHRTPVLAALLVLVMMVAGTTVSVRQSFRASHAQRQAVLTLVDMYTRSGLTAGANNNPAQAALWFANAAILAAEDPERREANLRRTAAWRREIAPPVRALNTGYDYLDRMLWNPRHPAMIVWAARESPSLVWDLASDRLWRPASSTNLFRAVWDSSGERIAAYDGNSVAVLAYPSGEALARLPGLEFAPALAFSNDDRWLAVGGADAFLWDWKSGGQRRLPKRDQAPERFQFSRDGKSLILQTVHHVGVCEIENPKDFRHPPVTNSYAVRAEFLGDGESYLTGDSEGNIFVRDSLNGAVLENYDGSGADGLGAGGALATSRDGRFIARRSRPVIDRSAQIPARFPVHKNAFDAAAFSPDGTWLASGSYDTTVKLWALPSGESGGDVGVHQHAIRHLAFSPDGTLLASDQYGLIRVWRVARPSFSRQVVAKETSLAALSRDGSLLAPAGYLQLGAALTRTWVVETASGNSAGPELVPGGIIMDAGFSPDNRWLALSVSTTPDRDKAPMGTKPGAGNVQLWDYRAGQRLGEPIPLPSEPRGIAIHPSGQWIGVACQAGEGVEIDVATRQPKILFRHSRFDDSRATLANGLCVYSPDGRCFVVYAFHRFLHLWDRESQRELIDPFRESNTFDADFSGTTMAGAVVTMSSHVEFLDTRTGEPAAPAIPYSNWPMRVRFSPDGQLLLTAGGTRVGQVWDWRKGRLVCPALPHDDQLMAGDFIPGKPWVVTGGHDGMIKFWDHRTGMPVGPPLRRSGWVLQLEATPDGRTLVASGHFGGVIEVLDMKALFPEPDLTPEATRLLAEIEAAAEVHPGGDLVPLTREAWLERWQSFRAKYPNFPAHHLSSQAGIH